MSGKIKSDHEEINIWQDKKIPPLDYCTLDRAAKLLCCEVDDLWHWRDRYYIDFYSFVDYPDSLMVDSVIELKEDFEPLKDLLLNHSNNIYFAFPFLTNLIPPCEERGDLALFGVFKPETDYNGKRLEQFIQTGENEFSISRGMGHGLFRIGGRILKTPHPKIAGEKYVRLWGVYDCELYKFTAKSEQIHLSKLSDSSIYVVKEDLEYLHKSMTTGYFDCQSRRDSRFTEEKQNSETNLTPDRRGLHHSISRESHIMALVYSFLNYRNEIFVNGKYGKVRHAKVTLDHWDFISPGVKEPSDRHLLGILRDFNKLPHERSSVLPKKKGN